MSKVTMATGVGLVTIERARQVNAEGYDAAHDDEHKDYELARAAECYIALANAPDSIRSAHRGRCQFTWPWVEEFWKPSPGNTTDDRIRELVKAGALICAEIDRLERLKERE